MNPVTLAGIDEAQLEPLTKLGQGGQAVVYATAFRLAEFPWQLAYKQFKPGTQQADPGVVDALVDRFGRMAPTDPRIETGAWPLRPVTKQGRLSGFLMRTAPEPFFFQRQRPKGPAQRQLLEVQHLLNTPDFLLRSGLQVTDHWRLDFLHDVARMLDELHSDGIAVGDLSPRNLLAGMDSEPRCFLLDCDAVTFQGRSLFEQFETTEWESPDQVKGTAATDSFKFALLAVRLFACDQFQRDPAQLKRVGPALVTLAERGLQAGDGRPGPGEWVEELSRATAFASTAPLPGRAPTSAPITVGISTANTGRASSGSPRPTVPTTPYQPTTPPSPSSAVRRSRRMPRLAAIGVVALCSSLVYLNPAPLQPITGPVHAKAASWVNGYQISRQVDRMSDVLAVSARDRVLVATAVKAIDDCEDTQQTAWLGQLQSGTESRHRSVDAAKALDVDLIQSGDKLKKALVKSLDLSAKADDAFVKWAKRRVERDCAKSTDRTKNWKTADKRSEDAGKYKSDFGKLWKPIAQEHGKPEYGRKNL